MLAVSSEDTDVLDVPCSDCAIRSSAADHGAAAPYVRNLAQVSLQVSHAHHPACQIGRIIEGSKHESDRRDGKVVEGRFLPYS